MIKMICLSYIPIRTKKIIKRRRRSPLHSSTALSFVISQLPPPPGRKPSAGRNMQTAARAPHTLPSPWAPARLARSEVQTRTHAPQPDSHLCLSSRSTMMLLTRVKQWITELIFFLAMVKYQKTSVPTILFIIHHRSMLIREWSGALQQGSETDLTADPTFCSGPR